MRRDAENFFKKIYFDNDIRIQGKRDLSHDLELFAKNEKLLDLERDLVERHYSEKYPLVFIIGVPRSGTTLLSQILISAFDLAYISNYVSKYFMAPLCGFQEFSKLRPSQNEIAFASKFGNTSGDAATSEFGYFWQWWMDHTEHDELSQTELDKIDWKGLKKELYAISGFRGKPLLLKNIVYQDFKIKRLAKEFPNSKYIFVSRQPLFTVQSILESRIKRYGSVEYWWSIRPKNINELKKLSPVEQVVAQFAYTDEKIRQGLEMLNPENLLELKYESFVEDTETGLKSLSAFLNMERETLNLPEMTSTNNWRIGVELRDEAMKLIKERGLE